MSDVLHNSADLLRSAAAEIDRLDATISALNDDKAVIFGNVRETVPPADFKAWRAAIRLRQKRGADPEKYEAEEEALARMLALLGALPESQAASESPPETTTSAANGLPSEEPPTRAGAPVRAHGEPGDHVEWFKGAVRLSNAVAAVEDVADVIPDFLRRGTA